MALVTDARHRDLTMEEIVTELMAGRETVTPDIVPRAFVYVLAKLDGVGAGDDQSFFDAHFRMTANIKMEAVLKRR